MKHLIIIGARGFGRCVYSIAKSMDSYNREFDIKVPISRSELAYMLSQGLNIQDAEVVKKYTDVTYPSKVYLMFGKETAGLPETLLKNNKNNCVRIPMRNGLRSLNLSNSVAIAAYEVLRQRNFEGLQESGELTHFSWND